MNDKPEITIDQVRTLASNIAENAADIQNDVSKLMALLTPVNSGGTSPVIITDGSLVITSISDPIIGPTGTGPYSYTVMNKVALNKLKHCNGDPLVPIANDWSLTIPFTVNSTRGAVVVQKSDDGLAISGVPVVGLNPTSNDPPGENVLAIPVSPDWTDVVFDSGHGGTTTKVGRHLSLHFSNAD